MGTNAQTKTVVSFTYLVRHTYTDGSLLIYLLFYTIITLALIEKKIKNPYDRL
jgi:hypothetical protein